MTQRSSDRRRPDLSLRLASVVVGLLALVVVLLLLVPTDSAAFGSPTSVHPPSAAPASSGVRAAAGGVFNPNCAKLFAFACVSIESPTETNIVPPQGSYIALSEPNTTASIPLEIKARYRLDQPNSPHTGANSLFALNVSCVTWNGDPYYSQYDSQVWHANNGSAFWSGPTNNTATNQSYPWWYLVVISVRSNNGTQQFFPGMTCQWYLEYTSNQNGSWVHQEGPKRPGFQFTFAGAWPYSPYPGVPQYAGRAATFQDIHLNVTPTAPNWNDSMSVVLNTTPADGFPVNASIGSAYLRFSESAPNGSLIANETFLFPVNVSQGNGAQTSSIRVPASLAQVAGATVTYFVVVADVAYDTLFTPAFNYTVGGNGSFISGTFTNDVALTISPSTIEAAAGTTTQVAPGQTIGVVIASRSPTTAINAAAIRVTVLIPSLAETQLLNLPLKRVQSVEFNGSIPALPIGSQVNFTIFTWDFNQRLETSPTFGYEVQSLDQLYPVVPSNETFFYIEVFDNGTHGWVNNATVQVRGVGNYVNTLSPTTYGLTYPNATTGIYVPLLVPANASYYVELQDSRFQPATGPVPQVINVTFLATHGNANKQTLVQTANYLVVQEGNAILFYLNQTPPVPTPSPAVNGGGSVPLGGLVGIGAVVLASIPLAYWYREIRARRKAEEKRVTL